MTSPILVIGATGHVGRPLVQALRARGLPVRAASRAGQPVDGAEGVAFDISDPRSFDAAFAGIGSAFVMLPTGSVAAQALLQPVVDALSARRVKIVLLSVFGVDADDSLPYRQVELALQRAGTPHVILRPNWFADNFHTFWKAGIDQGVIAVPAGSGRTSFIDVRDIADAAAAALSTDAHDGRAFNLTGPQALDYAEATAQIGSALGRSLRYEPIDDARFVAQLTGAGVPQDYAQFLAAIFHPVREGWTAAVTDDVRTLTGHAARPLASYLQAHLSDLRR